MVIPTRHWPRPFRSPAEFLLYQKKKIMKKCNTRNWMSDLMWKFGKGPMVRVKWPCGWVMLHEHDDGSKVSTESADPNDHYRPWLEANVGKQGWDWVWEAELSPSTETDNIKIKFRKGKSDFASVVVLKWS